jgi:hypothetical protein
VLRQPTSGDPKGSGGLAARVEGHQSKSQVEVRLGGVEVRSKGLGEVIDSHFRRMLGAHGVTIDWV